MTITSEQFAAIQKWVRAEAGYAYVRAMGLPQKSPAAIKFRKRRTEAMEKAWAVLTGDGE